MAMIFRLLAILVGAAALAAVAYADAPFTNACQTPFGVCFVGPAPVGAPCTCVPAPGVYHPGRMTFLEAPSRPATAHRPPPPNFHPISNACGTRFGVCQVMPAPVGSGCGCGRDPGQIIPR